MIWAEKREVQGPRDQGTGRLSGGSLFSKFPARLLEKKKAKILFCKDAPIGAVSCTKLANNCHLLANNRLFSGFFVYLVVHSSG
jgi:hypothetical protein